MTKVFDVWRFVISVSWAKSFTWSVTTGNEVRTMYFSIHKVSRENNSAIAFIFMPLSIVVGYVSNGSDGDETTQ